MCFCFTFLNMLLFFFFLNQTVLLLFSQNKRKTLSELLLIYALTQLLWKRLSFSALYSLIRIRVCERTQITWSSLLGQFHWAEAFKEHLMN